MKKEIVLLLLVLAQALVSTVVSQTNELWYDEPAERWFEALPIGNGLQGAMVYGGVHTERLALTENTYYSGAVSNNIQKGASTYIPEIREALIQNEYDKTDVLAQNLLGRKSNYGTNLPVVDLNISFEHLEKPKNYKRTLRLDQGLAAVTYDADGILYSREYLASNPDKVIAFRFTSNKKKALNFEIAVDGYERPIDISSEGSDLVFSTKARETKHSDGKTGVRAHSRVSIIDNDGTVIFKDEKIKVSGASDVTIIIAMATTFNDNAAKRQVNTHLSLVEKKSFDQIKEDHLADHAELYDRVYFTLGTDSLKDIATDERVRNVVDGAADNSLVSLMYQYARYLTIASSRENSVLPSHLQGIWNDNVACQIGWTCDMHLDVNTQMNYWLTETTNLQECAQPLFSWIEDTLAPSGEKTAREVYGAAGWVAHTVSNPWGFTAPGWNSGWGLHPTGGAWIASHLWDHYTFTGDTTYLRDHAYPVVKGCAKFFMDYMFEDPASGLLMTGPSYSPENKFLIKDKVFALDRMPTSDLAVIQEIMKMCIESSRILGVDSEFANSAENILKKLPPYKIGSKGQLQEWYFDYEEALPNHRHMSHLLGVFPYASITPETTPKLANAAWQSVLLRKQPKENWEDTGWARSMLLLNSARLWKPKDAHENVIDMLRFLTEDNLMVVHPPTAGATSNVYELDGNTGLCAGVTEMLLQSHLTAKDLKTGNLGSTPNTAVLHFLPALPSQWADGEIKGILARGGFEIDLKWKNSRLLKAVVKSKIDAPLILRYNDRLLELHLKSGESYVWEP